MSSEPDPERLAALEARIAAMKGGKKRVKPQTVSGFSQGEMAWRMVIELVTGMLLGMAIGYGLDWLTGLQPVFLVIFALLGFAAGVKTMLGTAKQMSAAAPASATTTAAEAARDEGE